MRLFAIRTSLLILLAVALWHLVLVAQAISQGGMAGEGSQIWQLPWGKTLLVDVYLGLFAVAFLVVYLEKFRPWAWALALSILVLGNAPFVFYLLFKFWRTKNSPH